jgi:hypothetical protein
MSCRLVAFSSLLVIHWWLSHRLSDMMADIALVCSIYNLVCSILYLATSSVRFFKELKRVSCWACFLSALSLTAYTIAIVVLVKEQDFGKAILSLSRASIFFANFWDVSFGLRWPSC